MDAFIDSQLRGGQRLPALGAMRIADGRVSADVKCPVKVVKAELNYTADSGPWQKRGWKVAPAEVQDSTVTAKLPEQRPLVCYLRITDERGLSVTAPHVELSKETK